MCAESESFEIQELKSVAAAALGDCYCARKIESNLKHAVVNLNRLKSSQKRHCSFCSSLVVWVTGWGYGCFELQIWAHATYFPLHTMAHREEDLCGSQFQLDQCAFFRCFQRGELTEVTRMTPLAPDLCFYTELFCNYYLVCP